MWWVGCVDIGDVKRFWRKMTLWLCYNIVFYEPCVDIGLLAFLACLFFNFNCYCHLQQIWCLFLVQKIKKNQTYIRRWNRQTRSEQRLCLQRYCCNFQKWKTWCTPLPGIWLTFMYWPQTYGCMHWFVKLFPFDFYWDPMLMCANAWRVRYLQMGLKFCNPKSKPILNQTTTL